MIDLVLRAASRVALAAWLKTPPHALLKANSYSSGAALALYVVHQ